MTDEQQERIDDHYSITLYELENGATINEMRDIINEYKEFEDYEACAGIKKAIDIVSFLILTQLTRYCKIKTKLKYDTNRTKKRIN